MYLTLDELRERARRAVQAAGGPLRAAETMTTTGDPISDSAIIQALRVAEGTRRAGTLVRIVSVLENAEVEARWWVQKRKTSQTSAPAQRTTRRAGQNVGTRKKRAT